MSEQSTAVDHEANPPPGDHEAGLAIKARMVNRTTLVLLTLIILLFIWYVVADRLTPYTTSARTQAYVVAVVPDVSGYIQQIPIKKNQLAAPGETLIQLDTQHFEIAVRGAEAALAVAGQEVGASTAAVATATAKLTEERVRLDEAQKQAARLFVLEEKGIVPRAQGDQARSAVATARAKVTAAEAELVRAKEALGAVGESNPRVRLALAKLEQARLNLSHTTIKAPSKGIVGGLKVDEGAYAQAGQALMTFIAIDDIWIEAFMTENNLGRVKSGDPVEIAFDAFPGRIFRGVVKNTAWGMSTGKKADLGDLPTAQKVGGWLREPQRFSVIIEATDYTFSDTGDHGLRHNSQVDVIIYTGDHFFWNGLGKLWIRLLSLLSYAY